MEDILNNIPPDLFEWKPEEKDIFYVYENSLVRATYEEKFGLKENTLFSTFIIKKNHYKERMTDIVQHLNYFLTFYDVNKELFLSTLSIKFTIEQNPNISQKIFKEMIIKRIITPTLVKKVKLMAERLYYININNDEDGKYKNTPKITNIQAKQLTAISFCIRLILPLCIHYSNINNSFIEKRDYIKCFNKIFLEIIEIFEEDDTKIFNQLCSFVEYRVNKAYNTDLVIWFKKQQLYGITKNLYLEELIHEVIIVKSLYKSEYNKSIVSFIDGIIFSYHCNFRRENFKVKPVEINPEESSSDSDEYFSYAEALEMSVYRIDESNTMISDANINTVIKDIEEKFNINISEEEFLFYYNNIKLNNNIQFLLQLFYSRFFKDSYAVMGLTKKDTIKLIIYMKKYLQLKNMIILPHILTSKIKTKYKENLIKNSEFIHKLYNSSIYKNIIQDKFKYIKELNMKDDIIVKKLSMMINSSFEFIDYDEKINGMNYENINIDQIILEFSLFLSIV
jgi:hypothetical protein